MYERLKEREVKSKERLNRNEEKEIQNGMDDVKELKKKEGKECLANKALENLYIVQGSIKWKYKQVI